MNSRRITVLLVPLALMILAGLGVLQKGSDKATKAAPHPALPDVKAQGDPAEPRQARLLASASLAEPRGMPHDSALKLAALGLEPASDAGLSSLLKVSQKPRKRR